MKTYKIIRLSAHLEDSKWTILVEEPGRCTPTFQSFNTKDAARRMVDRFIAADAAT